MKSIVKLILTVMLASLLVVMMCNTASRVLGAVIVHKDATIVLAEPCVKNGPRDDATACIVEGDLTHHLFSGDAVITLKNGRVVILPAERVRASAYVDHQSWQDTPAWASVAIFFLLSAAGGVMLFRRGLRA